MIEELQALNDLIRRDMNDLADHISTGGCPDWADYQKNIGKMEGFAIAERHLLDMRRRIELGEESTPDDGMP